MELTPATSRVYQTILNAHNAGQEPTREDLRSTIYGTRRNTLSSVSRAINTLEEQRLVDVRFSTAEGAEVIIPTERKDTQ